MELGFKVDGFLRKRGWRPGVGTDWDRAGAVRELRFFRDRGFTVVEFTADIHSSTGPFFHFSNDEWRLTRQVVEEAGLRCHSILGWRRMISREPWVSEKQGDLDHIAAVSAILGLKIIDTMVAYPMAAAGGRPPFRSLWHASTYDFEASAAFLKPYARRLADFGAALAIEIHEDTLSDTAVSALRLRELINEPNVGLNPDTLHNAWQFPGEAVADAATQARLVAPYVNHWHVKQFLRRPGPDGQLVAGSAHADEGDQPIATLVQHLVAAGYQGAAIHECGRGDHAYALIRFRDYLRWLLDEYVPNVPL